MSSIVKIQEYINKELDKMEDSIVSGFKSDRLIKYYHKNFNHFIKVITNPINKNFYILHLFSLFINVGRFTTIEKRDEVFNNLFKKLEGLMVKVIIDDLGDENSKNIFMAFDLLNQLIDEMEMPINEKLEIYNYVVNKNIKNKINEKEVKKIGNIPDDSEYIDVDFAKKLFYIPNVEKYLKKKYFIKILNETVNATRKYAVDATDQVISHEVFKREYNKEHLNEESIDQLIKALEIFNFNESELRKVRSHYNKKYEAENKKEINLSMDLNTYNDVEEERKHMKEELDEVLEIKSTSCILKRYLNFDELKRIAYIWKKLNNSEESLKDIIDQNSIYLAKLTAEMQYEYYIDLLEYYSESYGFTKELDDLKMAYKNGKIQKSNMKYMLNYMPNMKEYLTKKD